MNCTYDEMNLSTMRFFSIFLALCDPYYYFHHNDFNMLTSNKLFDITFIHKALQLTKDYGSICLCSNLIMMKWA